MMSERVKFIQYFTVIIILAAFITGCNIFDFASDAEKSPTEKAEEAIRDGDYAEAKIMLTDAVKDSTDAYALYLDAKATVLDAGINLFEIVELIEGDGTQNGNLKILALVDELTDEEQTSWYKANLAVSANLAKIFNGEIIGTFDPEDIALDYTVSNLMSGVLGIRDTNRDGIIDDNDFELNLELIVPGVTENYDGDTEGYAFSGATFEDEFGNIQEFDGLEVFLGDFAAKALSAGKITKIEGYEPDDINDLIAFVLYLLEDGTESLKILFEKTSFEPDKIEQYIEEIAVIINFYWYDDGIDNDGDGQVDEETINGIDDDEDGLVDEDTKYYPGADPTDTRNTQYHELFYTWQEHMNEINGQ